MVEGSLFPETLRTFQDKIQEIFLQEAGNTSKFKEAVQTSRLLGYIEFIVPEMFDAFHQCLMSEKSWSYLSAKKRERLLNECRSSGRSVSSVTRFTDSGGTVRPAENKKNEQTFQHLRSELNDLRTMIEKLTKEVQNNQDKIMQSLNTFENNLPRHEPVSTQPARPVSQE